MDIIFATKNKGKLREIKKIMSEFNITSMEETGINIDIEENGSTFEENAIIKAREIKKYKDCIVLADDSGLEIDYLGGKPGVLSARFLGEDTPYDIKNNKIIDMLDGVAYEKRTARFVCAIAAVLPDGRVITTKATMEGYIDDKQSGGNGFGYDPIFYLPEYKMTSAQISQETKNNISHRGKALKEMKKELEKLGELI